MIHEQFGMHCGSPVILNLTHVSESQKQFVQITNAEGASRDSVRNNTPVSAGDMGWILSGRSLEEETETHPVFSLENLHRQRGAWWAIV